MKVDGACLCGAIRIEAEADPEKTVVCHCTDCQTGTGTAFRVSVPVPGESFKLTGKPAIYIRTTAESGNPRAQAFCPTCGTPFYATTPGEGTAGGLHAARRRPAPARPICAQAADLVPLGAALDDAAGRRAEGRESQLRSGLSQAGRFALNPAQPGSSETAMDKFTTLEGVAAPLKMINVDTDMIIPKQYLKTIKRTGLGTGLFSELRYKDDGSENPDFVLNKPAYRKAKILVVDDNFGCGSSREHAPWALLDFGIRCVISTSFGDIFYNNCFKNGILPIRVTPEDLEKLFDDAERGANATLSIDLPKQEIRGPDGGMIKFEVDDFRKHCLLNGLDDIGLTLQKKPAIETYESEAESRAALDLGTALALLAPLRADRPGHQPSGVRSPEFLLGGVPRGISNRPLALSLIGTLRYFRSCTVRGCSAGSMPVQLF